MVGIGSRLRAAVAGIVAAALPFAAAQAECTCRALGRDFALGQSACLATPRGPRLATCGMMLNNTAWWFSETACAVSVDRSRGGMAPGRFGPEARLLAQ